MSDVNIKLKMSQVDAGTFFQRTCELEAEVERLQSRLALQKSALDSICTCSWGEKDYFNGDRAASWMQKIAYDALDEVPKTEAFIKNKQAEAILKAAGMFVGSDFVVVRMILSEFSQSLRNETRNQE